MKKAIVLIAFFASCALVHAQSELNMAFTTTAGEVVMLSEGLEITFSNGQLVAKNKQEERSFALTALSKFYFTNAATGIEPVVGAEENEMVEVYTTSGQYVGRRTRTAEGKLDLPKGMYIVKGKKSNQKLIVK